MNQRQTWVQGKNWACRKYPLPFSAQQKFFRHAQLSDIKIRRAEKIFGVPKILMKIFIATNFSRYGKKIFGTPNFFSSMQKKFSARRIFFRRDENFLGMTNFFRRAKNSDEIFGTPKKIGRAEKFGEENE